MTGVSLPNATMMSLNLERFKDFCSGGRGQSFLIDQAKNIVLIEVHYVAR